jgi:sterol desaturase/sphingolipid hydroxylase (fatty acid hydroxylase superfamily)
MSPRSVATTNLHDRTNLINFSRCLLIILIGYTAFQLDYLDATIKHYWDNVLYQSKLFRLDSFEVICSSLLFAFYSFGWLILDYYIPAAHAFRISSNSTNQSWKGRESALSQETLWYTLPWIFFDLIVPRRHILFAEFVAAPSFLQLVRDICLSLVLYDFFFYIGHRTMHRNRYLLRSIHSKHHQMGI